VQFARITREHLALLSLRRAADAIDQVAGDPTSWVFVILDLHRALNCALVAALLSRPGSALSASSPEQAGSRILRQAVHRLAATRAAFPAAAGKGATKGNDVDAGWSARTHC
jgi:hypothetical protein